MNTTGKSSSETAAIDASASEWVVRQTAGLDARATQALDAWLAADPAHREAYLRLARLSAALGRARKSGASAVIIAQLQGRARKRRARRRHVTGVAAALVLIVAGWWAWPRYRGPLPSKQVVVRSPEPLRRLPDGSIVELNSGADIVVRYEASARHVELVRGEALFRVEKDATRPFIVTADGVAVRAVGTAFNVRVDAATVEVLVTEGKVDVDDSRHGRSLLPAASAGEAPILNAGQQAVIATGADGVSRQVQVAPLAPAEISARLAWRIPRLEFDDVRLAEAVTELNRQNRVQIRVADATVRELRISGSFVQDDPQTFARLVAATLELTVDRHGDGEIVLRRKARQ